MAALLSGALALGCAGRRPEARATAAGVAGSARLPVRASEDDAAQKRVRELLAKPLDADAAIEIALTRNPSLQAVLDRVGIAQAELMQAGLPGNPVLAGSLRMPLGGGPARPAGSLTQPVFDLALLPLRKELARGTVEREVLLASASVLGLAAEVRLASLDLQAAQGLVELHELVGEASEAAAEIARRQRAAGNLSDLQLALEEEAAEREKLALDDADRARFRAREHLTRLMGLWGPEASAWSLSGTMPEIPARDPALDHLESLALRRRMELAAGRSESAQLSRALQISRRWRWFAVVDVGVDAERDDGGVDLLGPTLSLEIPLFDRRQASLARLEAAEREAAHRQGSAALEIRGEVRDARDRLVRARRRAAHYRDTLLPLRERIVSFTRQRHDAMLLGIYDLLRARQEEIEMQQEYLEAIREYWGARLDLERATGGPLEGETT